DDLWASPREITTRNAEYLPRFQSLCERFRFKPVYLANYEMAMSDVFVDFARDVVGRGAGEIGMHLHAWNSPPLEPLTNDDFRFHPYLIEYPESVMREKIRILTRLLEDRFDQAMVSHRAGRWAFRIPLMRQAAHRISPKLSWLCPTPLLEKHNLNAMLQVAREAREGAAHVEFMLHSSELMPGGSPSFPDASDIDRLYEHLEILFDDLA